MIERIVGIFAASLVANYLIVSLLVLVHAHVAFTWWIIILAEAAYLALTWHRSPVQWNIDLRGIGALIKISFFTALAGILLFAGLGIMSYLLYVNWGSIYVGNDDVASWDRWATEWAAGKFPADSSLYPQLLPGNSSITYVLLRTADVKFFAKSITPLYSVLPILLFLSLAIRRRDDSYLIGGALYAWILFQYMGLAFLMYGYADVPLAFFGFVTFYCVFANPNGPDRLAVMAGLVAAVGTLLTKQGGIYAVAAMSIYALHWRRKQANEPGFFRRDAPTAMLLALSGFCTIWYAVKIVRIFLGRENPHMWLLIETLHQGRSYLQRIPATFHMFMSARPYTAAPVTIAIAVLVAASLLFKRTRAITLYWLLPFLLMYTLFFSYEIRTASLGFPLVALVCGAALRDMISSAPRFASPRIGHGLLPASVVTGCLAAWVITGERGRDLLPQRIIALFTDPWISEAASFYADAVFVVTLACLVILTAVRIDSATVNIGRLAVLAIVVFACYGAAAHRWEDVVFSQIQLARTRIGDPEVNARLYSTVSGKNITSGIITDYWFLRSLPDIKQLFRQTYCYAPCTTDGLRKSIVKYPDAGFILMANANLAPETRQFLDSVAPGEFTTLFLVNGYRMIQVNRTAIPPAR